MTVITWRQPLWTSCDTAFEFRSAISSAKSSFISHTADPDRFRFPLALIRSAEQHIKHVSESADSDLRSEWGALSEAVILARSIQLSRHYTTLPSSQRQMFQETLSETEGAETFARTQGLDVDVVKAWREVWEMENQLDAILAASEAGKDFDRARYIEISDAVDDHWVMRGLGSVVVRPGKDVVPLWWGQLADGSMGVDVRAIA